MKSQKYNRLEYRDFKDYKIMLISFYLNDNILFPAKSFRFKFYRSLDVLMDKDFIIFEIFLKQDKA